MSYAPAPGTVAFRVLAHMELLHKGSEISTGTLNTALGIESDRLIPGLEAAIKHRAIFRRKKGGHPRSPVFWSLVDHSKDSHEAPPPGPQTPTRAAPAKEVTAGADKVVGGTHWASILTNAVEPVCDHGESLGGECLQCRAEIVRGRETPAEIIKAEAPAEAPGVEIEYRRTCSDGSVFVGKGIARMVGLPPAPLSPPSVSADTSPARWGLFSDGEFHIQKAGQRIELDRAEFEGLVAFLERMAA